MTLAEMEISVSNVSKYVSEALIRELFAHLGTVLGMQLIAADQQQGGAEYCTILFLNLSEALKALCLDSAEFGDKRLSVKLKDETAIFNGKNAKFDESSVKNNRTILVQGITRIDDSLKEALFGDTLLCSHTVGLSKNTSSPSHLLEFKTRQAMLQGMIKLRTKAVSDPGFLQMTAEEAWKAYCNNSKDQIVDGNREHRERDTDQREQDGYKREPNRRNEHSHSESKGRYCESKDNPSDYHRKRDHYHSDHEKDRRRRRSRSRSPDSRHSSRYHYDNRHPREWQRHGSYRR